MEGPQSCVAERVTHIPLVSRTGSSPVVSVGLARGDVITISTQDDPPSTQECRPRSQQEAGGGAFRPQQVRRHRISFGLGGFPAFRGVCTRSPCHLFLALLCGVRVVLGEPPGFLALGALALRGGADSRSQVGGSCYARVCSQPCRPEVGRAPVARNRGPGGPRWTRGVHWSRKRSLWPGLPIDRRQTGHRRRVRSRRTGLSFSGSSCRRWLRAR
jgi:hypothetical protein